MVGAVLLDENLRELNLSSPTAVGPAAYARLEVGLPPLLPFLSSFLPFFLSFVLPPVHSFCHPYFPPAPHPALCGCLTELQPRHAPT